MYAGRPVVAVSAVIESNGRTLMVKRKNPPSMGKWALPGGKVRLGEVLADALVREVMEECSILVSPGELLDHYDLIERDGDGQILFHYVILCFRALYRHGTPAAGDDAGEVRWISPGDMKKLAVNSRTIKLVGAGSC